MLLEHNFELDVADVELVFWVPEKNFSVADSLLVDFVCFLLYFVKVREDSELIYVDRKVEILVDNCQFEFIPGPTDSALYLYQFIINENSEHKVCLFNKYFITKDLWEVV